MMFQKSITLLPQLNNANATVNGKANWFRTVNSSDDNIFGGMEAIMLNTANQYQFLLKDNLKKVYRYSLSTLTSNYNLFDKSTINGAECRLFGLENLDIQNQKVTGYYEEV